MASSKTGCTIVDLSGLKMDKLVCLTLDLEQDYGELLDEPCYEGLEHIPSIVNFFRERGIPLTCFVQGSLFETHPAQIEELCTLDVDFELHSYSHPSPKLSNTEFEVEKGKEAYKRFFGKDPVGYRAPLCVINSKDYETLASHEFRFDSSICPSMRPGVFNNFSKPATPYLVDNPRTVEFPLTVLSNIIRIPMGLSYINLLGKSYLRLLKLFPLPNLMIVDFHLHDLFGLSSSNRIPLRKLPFIYRSIFRRIYQARNGKGLDTLDEFITILCNRGYSFSKLIDIYEVISKEHLLGTEAYEQSEIGRLERSCK